MTTEQFEQAKPCPFCGEGATAEEFLKGCEHDGSFIPVHEVIRLMNAFAASQKQQPTAEGAEEILDKYPHSIEYPSFVHENSAIAAMTEFATLHAQRLAEKMVEERMEQYKAQFKDRPNPLEVNPYDSKGIKRIRNRKIH